MLQILILGVERDKIIKKNKLNVQKYRSKAIWKRFLNSGYRKLGEKSNSGTNGKRKISKYQENRMKIYIMFMIINN